MLYPCFFWIKTKLNKALYGEKVEMLNIKLLVHIGTKGVWGLNLCYTTFQLNLYRVIYAVCHQIHTK
jgi:hypothetical protein